MTLPLHITAFRQHPWLVFVACKQYILLSTFFWSWRYIHAFIHLPSLIQNYMCRVSLAQAMCYIGVINEDWAWGRVNEGGKICFWGVWRYKVSQASPCTKIPRYNFTYVFTIAFVIPLCALAFLVLQGSDLILLVPQTHPVYETMRLLCRCSTGDDKLMQVLPVVSATLTQRDR